MIRAYWRLPSSPGVDCYALSPKLQPQRHLVHCMHPVACIKLLAKWHCHLAWHAILHDKSALNLSCSITCTVPPVLLRLVLLSVSRGLIASSLTSKLAKPWSGMMVAKVNAACARRTYTGAQSRTVCWSLFSGLRLPLQRDLPSHAKSHRM